MPACPERFLTIGEISRRLNRDIHQIEYLIRSRGIPPQGMAGNARVFVESDVETIAEEIRRIESRRVGRAIR
jgi:hypothetical protein